MKKITLIIALLGAISFYGQQKVAAEVQRLVSQKAAFTKFEPLAPAEGPNERDIKKVVNNAAFATLDRRVANSIFNNKPQNIELAIPYNGIIVTVQLYRNEILASGFHLDTNEEKNTAFEPGIHYRGIIKGDSSSLASFSFFRGSMSGMISNPELGNLVINRLQEKSTEGNYIIYQDSQLTILNDFNCSASDAVNSERNTSNQTARGADMNKCVTVYFEIDHEIYLQNGSSVQQTENWMEGLFNNIQTLFANDGITIALQSATIWVTQDPYFGTSSEDYLMQFGTQTPSFDGDIGQLIGIDNGGYGGLAYLDALCSDFNHSYVDIDIFYASVPLFSWTVEAMTHELGHLIGSPHTHACVWNGNNTPIDDCGTIAGYPEGDCDTGLLPAQQGTIMSYCHLLETGINLANGFGPQPTALMQNTINSSFCLGSGCAQTCPNTVSQFTVGGATATTATLSWTDDAGGPWEVAYAPVNSIFTNWQLVTDNNLTIDDLNPNTYYKFAIRPVCGEERGLASEVIIASGADWCSGAVFTDIGGPTGAYGDNQHIIRTLMPSAPGQKIKAVFTSFNIENGFDFLYVYNGPNTDSPLLAVLSGNSLPSQFQSTAEDGSLTFEFTSDDSVTAPGWKANISCTADVAGVEESTFTNFSYYPNPTANSVTITAADAMQEIRVYNVAGQLLLHKKVDAVEATADLSSFANGVYFFKVTGNGREANFRIVKQN